MSGFCPVRRDERCHGRKNLKLTQRNRFAALFEGLAFYLFYLSFVFNDLQEIFAFAREIADAYAFAGRMHNVYEELNKQNKGTV